MNNSNQQTLQSYEDHIQEYIDGTPSQVDGDFQVWLDSALAELPTGAAILELGSAFGRDAAYIEQKGYSVKRTDAARSFVEYLREQGHSADILNIVTNEIGGSYDMVYASAVLLHLTIDELESALNKIYGALKSGGIMAFSVKKGDGSEWSEAKIGAPRFFQYWQPDELRSKVEAAGFQDITVNCDVTDKWIFVTAHKKLQ